MADQKINIIFTGDVTQLNKVVQSAVAELANFEAKLKESLGVEGFAAINQQVEQLRNKFKSLSTIDIKANPQQALTAINEVLTGVAKIKSSEVFLKANNKDALAAITQVENFANSIKATISIKADSSGVVAQIQDLKTKLAGLEADVKVRVTGLDKLNTQILEVRTQIEALENERISVSTDIDISQIDKKIADLKSKLVNLQAEVLVKSTGVDEINADLLKTKSLIDTFEEIKLVVDSGNVLTEISRIEKEIADLQALVISPDISETQVVLFSRNIDALKIKLAELQKIKVSFDTSGIAGVVESIKARFLSVFEIDIAADPAKALAAIDVIQSEIDAVKENKLLLDVDNAPALAALNKLQSELNDLRATIKIDPSAFDISKLKALLTPISQKVELNLNTRIAEAEIRTLLEQIRTLKGQDILITVDGRQAVSTIDEIEKELLQLQASLKTATDAKEILKLNQALLTLRNSISGTGSGQFAGNLNRAKNATFAFSQVLREAPAFAFSFQTGILALSNNLPILADRLKEARESGLSFSSIAGGMAKSLVSLPGILTIASTAILLLGDNLFNASKGVSSLDIELGLLSSSIKRGKDDLKDFNEQLEFLRSLQDIKIEIGISDTGDIALSKVKEDITFTGKEITRLAADSERAFDDAKAARDRFFNSLSSNQLSSLDAFSRVQDIPESIAESFSKSQKALFGLAKESTENLAELQSQLTGAYNKQSVNRARITLQETLNLRKQLEQQKADFDKFVNDTISKARQFAKEFGGTFVVPDLEDSFFKTKQQIFKASLKLLEDVRNVNLKIKIPVQVVTEADFLPVEIDFKDTKKEIEELTKGFFEGVKLETQDLEAPININVGNIQILEKVRKIFDSLRASIPQDLKLKLLDEESFVDFDRLNEAIKKAQENFLLLQTIGQSVGEGLASGFDRVFDALLEGENVFKALGEAVQQLVVDTIKAIAKMYILKLVSSFITGGTAAPLSFGSGFAGGGFGSANRGFIGGAVGSQAGGTLTTRVSGTDLVFVLNQGQNIVGRSG